MFPLCEENDFRKFYNETCERLRGFLFYKYGSLPEVDDIVQESFSRLWQNCKKVNWETAGGYLFRIARNLTASLKRSQQVHLNFETSSYRKDTDSETPEYVMLEKEYMTKLQEAISSLPERQREAFLLNRIDKLTYREVAEVMDVSVKAVEKLMHKALQKLKEKVGDL